MAEKVFVYETDGLSYTVTLTQEGDGPVMTTITVNEGQMDVNALYWGDDEHSGASANLGGPLNMNGGGSQFEGERIQWDDGLALSRPGLGRDGTSKDTFLTEGEQLGPFSLGDGVNLDDISFLGIRATSTSTPGGSIKGVSVPEEPEDPGDPDDDLPDGANKVLFLLPDGPDSGFGITILSHDAPLPAGLSEDDAIRLDPSIEEPTLQDYYNKMVDSLQSWGEIDRLDDLSEIKIYQVNDDGSLVLLDTLSVDELSGDDSPLPTVAIEEEEGTEIEEDEYDHSLVA